MEMEIGNRFMVLRARLDELQGLRKDVSHLINLTHTHKEGIVSGRLQFAIPVGFGDESGDMCCQLHLDNAIISIPETMKRYEQAIDAEIEKITELIKRL
jgi:hypothetical protein